MGIDSAPPLTGGLSARLIIGPALRAQSDRRLVRLVGEGHERAFEEIVRRYRRPLDRFAASIVGGLAEDVTQDSFRKALVALRRGDGEIELRPWLFRIVRNTALNELRDRPAAAPAEDGAGTVRSAAAEAEARAEVTALTELLRGLPENQRAALVMRELEGLGHEEIAAALGISRGGVRQAIARARAAVRTGLGALVPLPLLRVLAHGGDGAGAAGAAGAGAAAAGGGAIALKVGLATVLVAGSVGAGVAIDHHAAGRHRSDAPGTVAAATPAESGPPAGHPSPPPTAPANADPGRTGDRRTGALPHKLVAQGSSRAGLEQVSQTKPDPAVGEDVVARGAVPTAAPTDSIGSRPPTGGRAPTPSGSPAPPRPSDPPRSPSAAWSPGPSRSNAPAWSPGAGSRSNGGGPASDEDSSGSRGTEPTSDDHSDDRSERFAADDGQGPSHTSYAGHGSTPSPTADTVPSSTSDPERAGGRRPWSTSTDDDGTPPASAPPATTAPESESPTDIPPTPTPTYGDPERSGTSEFTP